MVSETSVFRRLDKALITLKVAVRWPQRRNELPTKALRASFVDAFWGGVYSGSMPVFLDETGFCLWTASRYGRAPAGQQAHVEVAASPGPNLTLVLAVCPTLGIVHHQLQVGGLHSADFHHFMVGLLHKLSGFPGLLFTVYSDNLRAHSPTVVADLFADSPHWFNFLPPYSPFLNPTEEAFNVIKHAAKGRLLEKRGAMAATDHLPHGSKCAARMAILQDVVLHSLQVVTPANVKSWVLDTIAKFPACQQYQDL